MSSNWAQMVEGRKKWNFTRISKICRSLASRSSHRFFLRNTLFCKSAWKISFSVKIFSLMLNSRLLHIKEKNHTIFLKTPFYKLVLRFQGHTKNTWSILNFKKNVKITGPYAKQPTVIWCDRGTCVCVGSTSYRQKAKSKKCFFYIQYLSDTRVQTYQTTFW